MAGLRYFACQAGFPFPKKLFSPPVFLRFSSNTNSYNIKHTTLAVKAQSNELPDKLIKPQADGNTDNRQYAHLFAPTINITKAEAYYPIKTTATPYDSSSITFLHLLSLQAHTFRTHQNSTATLTAVFTAQKPFSLLR